MKSIVAKINNSNRNIELAKDVSALSIVCSDKGHAFLVFEGISDNCKEGANTRIFRMVELGKTPIIEDVYDQIKASILDRSYSAEEGIKKLKQKLEQEKLINYKSISAELNPVQVEAFKCLVIYYKRLVCHDKLNYIRIGNPKVSRFLQKSIENSMSEETHEKSVIWNDDLIDEDKLLIPNCSFFATPEYTLKSILHESTDPILRKGHNCMSFAKEIWESIGLSYKESLLSKFVIFPPAEINFQRGKLCVIL